MVAPIAATRLGQCSADRCQLETILMTCADCENGYCFECMADWRLRSEHYDVYIESMLADVGTFSCIFCFIDDMMDGTFVNR
jgi:hypothetical protein